VQDNTQRENSLKLILCRVRKAHKNWPSKQVLGKASGIFHRGNYSRFISHEPPRPEWSELIDNCFAGLGMWYDMTLGEIINDIIQSPLDCQKVFTRMLNRYQLVCEKIILDSVPDEDIDRVKIILASTSGITDTDIQGGLIYEKSYSKFYEDRPQLDPLIEFPPDYLLCTQLSAFSLSTLLQRVHAVREVAELIKALPGLAASPKKKPHSHGAKWVPLYSKIYKLTTGGHTQADAIRLSMREAGYDTRFISENYENVRKAYSKALDSPTLAKDIMEGYPATR
jgi:hypothetical protein